MTFDFFTSQIQKVKPTTTIGEKNIAQMEKENPTISTNANKKKESNGICAFICLKCFPIDEEDSFVERVKNNAYSDESDKNDKKVISDEIKSRDDNNSVQTENKRVNDHNLNEMHTEYRKCLDVSENAIDQGDLAKAERILSKANRINPNEKVQEMLKNVQDLRALRSLSDEALGLENTPKSLEWTETAKTAARAKYPMKHVEEKIFENGEDTDDEIGVTKTTDVPPPVTKMTNNLIYEIQRVEQATDDYDILGKFTIWIEIHFGISGLN